MARPYIWRWSFSLLAATAVTTFAVKSPVFSARPLAARLLNFGGGMHPEFTVRLGSNSRPNILTEETFQEMMETLEGNRRAVLMRDGGLLSVPSRQYWASFGFLDSSEQFIGPYVTTNGAGSFTFPCNISGNIIIGWAPNRTACAGDASRIRISAASEGRGPGQIISGGLNLSHKQMNAPVAEAGLRVNPGEQLTLIRTQKSTQLCEYWESPDGYRGWYCASTPESLESINNRRPNSRITRREEVASYAVDVLQGDIVAQSEASPQGVQVLEGQQYSYPSGEIQPIDVAAAANSCDVLKALNPYYAMAADTPDAIRVPLTEQLKGHRDGLGVSGRPANLSAFEQAVVAEMNLARTNPAAYAEFLAERRQYFNGNRLELPGEVPLRTNEGVAGYDDAIAFLRSVRPRPALTVSAGMSQASADLVREQIAQGGIGHGRAGNTMTDRLGRYGTVGCSAGENVSYGMRTARDVVIQLIVDDGQFPKKHRENMFNPDFLVTGVACGSHPDWRSNCTITYANGYVGAEN